MESLVVDSVKELKSGARFVGIGSTAICYKTSSDRVLKQFRKTYRAHNLINRKENREEHFEYLSGLTNDTYVGPDILVKNLERPPTSCITFPSYIYFPPTPLLYLYVPFELYAHDQLVS